MISRSPFFYVGDKFKLLSQIQPILIQGSDRYIEPFVGGGSVLINQSGSKKYIASDANKWVIGLHKTLQKYDDFEELHRDLLAIINRYGLTNSSQGYQPPPKLIKEFPKTYFARVNEGPYNKLKNDFNSSSDKNFLELFLLVIYGFNRMWRFNKSEEFNIPVGNVDFNKNVVAALENYVSKIKEKKVEFNCVDVFTQYEKFNFKKSDFIYLDPPYLITASEYNKLWGETEEMRLLELMDRIHSHGAAFALSNVTTYRGKKNTALISWMKKYNVHEINSKYINYFDNGDKISREVLVTNYGK